jgi:hypothetical protein
MSAFTNSGRSERQKFIDVTGCFRPEAAIHSMYEPPLTEPSIRSPISSSGGAATLGNSSGAVGLLNALVTAKAIRRSVWL